MGSSLFGTLPITPYLGIKLPGPEPLGISGAGGTVPTGRGPDREGDFFRIWGKNPAGAAFGGAPLGRFAPQGLLFSTNPGIHRGPVPGPAQTRPGTGVVYGMGVS